MVVLDTNVVSEVMRSPADGPVADWIASKSLDELSITAVTLAEVLYGIRLLPAGRKRNELARKFQKFLSRGFGNRILSFDHDAAGHYAAIMVQRRRMGRQVKELDAMIGAITLARSADLATRNTGDFTDCGVRLINPWKEVG